MTKVIAASKSDNAGLAIFEKEAKDAFVKSDDVVEKLKKLEELALPLTESFMAFYEVVDPYLDAALDYVENTVRQISHHHAELILQIIAGIIETFLGSQFVLSIAAVESFRLVGLDKIKHNLIILKRNYQLAKEASKKDDKLDEDKDGTADVLELTKRELAVRKMKLVLKTVDPVQISETFIFFQISLFAILATLKAHFALAITLGSSLGQTIERSVNPVLQPSLRKLVSPEYHKWIPIVISYTIRSICISFAWIFVQGINALHSSFRGAFLLVRSLFQLALVNEWIKCDEVEVDFDSKQANPLYILAGIALAIAGFLIQVSALYEGLPFFVHLLMFPLNIVEYLLQITVLYIT